MVLSESPGTETTPPAATPTATPIPTPAPAAPTAGTEQEAGAVGTVTATSDLFDTNLSAAKGCDPAGCVADLTRVSFVQGVVSRHCELARCFSGQRLDRFRLNTVRSFIRTGSHTRGLGASSQGDKR